MVGLEIMIVILLIVILFIVLTGHIYIVGQPNIQPTPTPTPTPRPNPKKLIGGCEGTRYGCCPYSEIPKLNEIGSNCPVGQT
jgi:hypothetical protein